MPPFHPGELAVQERAGVRDRASRVGGSIRAEVPPAAKEFLEERRWVVLATSDMRGRAWASLLGGDPGFARVVGPREVHLDAAPVCGDPLVESLRAGGVAGLLAIDPPSRRRMRVNGHLIGAGVEGRASMVEARAAVARPIVLEADQVYANCPKYIHPHEADLAGTPAVSARQAGGLEASHRRWIRGADTFFIATVNPGEGADASHRGGPAGFVEVEGNRLTWPDYAGNMMYNTLGNIEAYPRAGLLFPDFERGARLMVTGRAGIDWDAARAARVPGAQRLVELEVEEVIELATT